MLSIRKRIGLSQQQMADQLKMSRSAYCMVEQGRRALPTAALLHAAQLEIRLANEQPAVKPLIPHPAEKPFIARYRRSYALLFARESSLRMMSRKLSARLETMQNLYRKNREWLQVIEVSMKEKDNDLVWKGWWKKQLHSAVKTLARCSLPAQMLLQSRIRLLIAANPCWLLYFVVTLIIL